jgi:hypothetical protein
MAQNGGKREGAGRKSKVDELALLEALKPYDEDCHAKIFQGIKEGDFRYIKLFMEYRYGKPKQQIEHSGNIGSEDRRVGFEEDESEENE